MDDLSDRLRFLIANPAIREAAGKAARKRVEEEYQWDKISRDIEQAYFEVLGLKSAWCKEADCRTNSARLRRNQSALPAKRDPKSGKGRAKPVLFYYNQLVSRDGQCRWRDPRRP